MAWARGREDGGGGGYCRNTLAQMRAISYIRLITWHTTVCRQLCNGNLPPLPFQSDKQHLFSNPYKRSENSRADVQTCGREVPGGQQRGSKLHLCDRIKVCSYELSLFIWNVKHVISWLKKNAKSRKGFNSKEEACWIAVSLKKILFLSEMLTSPFLLIQEYMLCI